MLIDVEHINFKQHFLFTSGADVQEIIQPLTYYGVKYFGYSRYDKDRGQIYLTNMPKFSEIFIKKKWHSNSFYAAYDKYVEGVYLGDFIKLNPDYIELYRDYHLGHALFMIRRYRDYTEIFHVYADIACPEMNHFYLNCLDIFEKFNLEFKEKATCLIKQYESQRFMHNGVDDYDLTNPRLMAQCQAYQRLGQANKLTVREEHCLYYLKQGYSAKMIAKSLNISHRTVEHHFAHIREKFSVSSIKNLLLLS